MPAVRIRVRAGTYDVSHALVVPEDASVFGEGVMLVDESRLPHGFDPAGRTVLRATSALVGDIVTLGNGAILRGLTIEDAPGRSGGNLVVVSSRAAGDSVAATIAECELINPNPSAVGAQGRRAGPSSLSRGTSTSGRIHRRMKAPSSSFE